MTSVIAVRRFVAPAPLCAVVVMAVNDLWLKPHFHNAITGKLSDFAICFFLPLYLAALLGVADRLLRPRTDPGAGARLHLLVGAVITAALFSAIKLSPAAARLFCAALALPGGLAGMSFRAVADPSDLVALPMVLLALTPAFATTRRSAS